MDTRRLFWEALEMRGSDPQEAVRQLERLSEAGDLAARFQLAVIFIEDDPSRARMLFEELDAADVDTCAYHAGLLLWDSDPEGAKRWFRRAFDRDDDASGAAAQALGSLLFNEGNPDAVDWLEKALIAGEPGVAYWVAAAVEDTDADRALQLYLQSAEEGQIEGYLRSGLLLQRRGDLDQARSLFKAGASLGNADCMLALCASWRGVNRREAARWFVRWLRAGGWRDAESRLGNRPRES